MCRISSDAGGVHCGREVGDSRARDAEVGRIGGEGGEMKGGREEGSGVEEGRRDRHGHGHRHRHSKGASKLLQAPPRLDRKSVV